MFGKRRQRPPSPQVARQAVRDEFEAVVREDPELSMLLESITEQSSWSTEQLILSRLRPLVRRRVPVRSVVAAPSLGAVRIRFADGTTVLCRGDRPGDAAVLGAAVMRGSVTVRFAVDGAGTRLDFAWEGSRRPLSVHVAGLDQPD